MIGMLQQIIIGFSDLLEFLPGPGRRIPVGMVFQCQLPVGSFYLLRAGFRGQSQNFMVILGWQGCFCCKLKKKAARREDEQLYTN